MLVLLDFEELHDIEKRRRQREVAILLPFHIHLSGIQLQILLKAHESVTVQNRQVIVTQDDHVTDSMRRILRPHTCTVYKQLIDLEGTVLNLFFSLLCFGEDGSWLRIIVTVHSFEEGGSVFVALMDDSVVVDESRMLVKLCLECLQVMVDVCDVLGLEYLYVEDTFDVDVAFHLAKGKKRFTNLCLGVLYMFLDV